MSFIPGILSKNWQLKVSAFAMAVLLWTVPRFEGQTSQELEAVPVRVQLNDPGWDLVQEPNPSTVSVTLSGPTREIIAIGVDRPPILIPIDDVSSGDTTVRLRTSWFRGAVREGVVVEDLRPGLVTLSFEEIEQRRIPFAVTLSGDLPSNRSVAGPPTLDPEVAVVFGTASRLEGLDSLYLEPIDLSLVSEAEPYMGVVDTTGFEGLDVLPLEVAVAVPLELTTVRELEGLPLDLPSMETGPQLRARPDSVAVVLVGARSLVEAVDPRGIRVTVPLNRTQLAPGQEQRVVVVVEGVPEWVDYSVSHDWVLLQRPVGQ